MKTYTREQIMSSNSKVAEASLICLEAYNQTKRNPRDFRGNMATRSLAEHKVSEIMGNPVRLDFMFERVEMIGNNNVAIAYTDGSLSTMSRDEWMNNL